MKQSSISPEDEELANKIALILGFDRGWNEMQSVFMYHDRFNDLLAAIKDGRESYSQKKYQEGELNGRIDEVSNIFEWGYPRSACTGVATHLKTVNDSGSLEDRIAYLNPQLERKPND